MVPSLLSWSSGVPVGVLVTNYVRTSINNIYIINNDTGIILIITPIIGINTVIVTITVIINIVLLLLLLIIIIIIIKHHRRHHNHHQPDRHGHRTHHHTKHNERD